MTDLTIKPSALSSSTATQLLNAWEAGAQRPPDPSHAEISRLAYEIYVASGSKDGESRQHWEQAEAELRGMGRVIFAAQDCCGDESPVVRASSVSVIKPAVAPLPTAIHQGKSPEARGHKG